MIQETQHSAANAHSGTTGLPGLDRVLRGLSAGDNVVWGVDSLPDYLRLAQPFIKAAQLRKRKVVYFRFAPHPPLFDDSAGIEIHRADPTLGFERLIRQVHEVIEHYGHRACYVFDSISCLADCWFSDQALGNFFMLTAPRLRELRCIAYFAIERDRHSFYAIEPIRSTAQFFLDVFTLDGAFYIRPIKVQYRSKDVMNTLHVEQDDDYIPVEESATLSQILSNTRWPRLPRHRHSGYWDRFDQDIARSLEERAAGIEQPGVAEALIERVRKAFRVHRSGIAPLARKWLKLEDFRAIRERMIGVGSIGGKALGMLVSRAIVRENAPELASRLEVHDSFFVGADVFVTFLIHNDIWWIREAQTREDGFLKDLDEGRKRVLNGKFTPEVLAQFESMLDYFGERPCIVRSSSILEDARGNAFSGKYESLFLANRGSREERLAALLDAIREVYASVLDPEALLYRKSRGLLESEERMALLIMRVSGRQRGETFFPQAAGVGLSYNPWCWHPDIDPEAGVARLVFGLGTRAVDRSDDDYTRLVSLSAPLRRPEASLDEQHDHCQRRMDLIDLNERALVSRTVEEIVTQCNDFPVRHFVDIGRDGMPWVTFNHLLKHTNIVADLRTMLEVLSREYGAPVDIEFAINFLDQQTYSIHLLQCRTFQVQKHEIGQEPMLPAEGRAVFEARGAVIGLGRRIAVHDILYVPTSRYAALAERDRYDVARLIEALVQSHDPSRALVLIGPGRWGTSSPSLGVPVRAGRIASACAVCEVVAMHSGLIPDVSLGTHFFNDLVEHDLLYMACFPDKPGNFIDESWLLTAPNCIPQQDSVYGAHIIDCVRWINVENLEAVLLADAYQQSSRLVIAER